MLFESIQNPSFLHLLEAQCQAQRVATCLHCLSRNECAPKLFSKNFGILFVLLLKGKRMSKTVARMRRIRARSVIYEKE